jgi:hypothetical protein
VKKNARIELRIPEGTKARWEGAADGLGYPSLSSFIEDTIEQVHFPDNPAVAQVLKMVPDLAVTLENGNTAVFEDSGKPGDAMIEFISTNVKEYGTDFKKPKGQCKNADKHRKQTFCKTCKKVIR